MSLKGLRIVPTFLITLSLSANGGLFVEGGKRQLIKRSHYDNGDYGQEVHVSSSVLQLGSSSQHPSLEHHSWQQHDAPQSVWVETGDTNHYQPHGGGDIWLTEPEPIHPDSGSVFSTDEGHAIPHFNIGGDSQLHTHVLSSSRLPNLPEISENVDFNNIADLKESSHFTKSYGK